MNPADTALTSDLAAAQQGDEDAFARVFRAVQPGLVRYLTSLVAADAEDIASETWAQACRDLRTFKGDIDGFRGWIARIGRNRALDHLRAVRRRPVVAAPTDELPDVAAPGDAWSLAAEGMSTEAAIAAIASLPRDQAEAVLLRAVMGLDASAAAKVLGKRAGAVRVAAHRGLQKLAQTITSDPVETTHGHKMITRSNTFGPSSAEGAR